MNVSAIDGERVNPAKRILVLVWPETSAYNATFRLARVLSQHNYEVVYAVPPHWADHIVCQGFRHVDMEVVSLPRTDSTSRNRLPRIVTGQDEARHFVQNLSDSLQWIKAEGFALVLLHSGFFHYALALRQLKIPFIPVNTCLASEWSWDIPPLFSPLKPIARHRNLSHLQCTVAWLMLKYLGAFNHRYRGIVQDRGSDWRSRAVDLYAIARHFVYTITEWFRLPILHHLLQMARRDGLSIGWGDYGDRLTGLELVLGPQVLDFPRQDPPRGRHYVGACVDTERTEGGFDWDQVDPDKPIVYCAIGSHGRYWNPGNRARLIDAVIRAFAAYPELQLLLQVTQQDRYQSLPSNVVVDSWFPQLQVLSRSSLMISHGGFGTVREALFYGVPMIIFPCGVDQPGNAARIVSLHAGVSGDIQTVTPQVVSAMVEIVLRDPTYRDHAKQLSQYLREDNACEKTLSLIDGYVSTGVVSNSARP